MTLEAVWIEMRDRGSWPLCFKRFEDDARPHRGVTKVILLGREDVAAVWAGDYRYAIILAAHLDALFTSSDAMRREPGWV
jgi:hypothetical protein